MSQDQEHPDGPHPLTLDNLIAQLTRLRAAQPDLAHAPIEIRWDPGHTTLGGAPAVKITSVHAGFDWDHGRIFLGTEHRIAKCNDELMKKLRAYENMVGHLHLVLSPSRALSADKQVEQVHACLEQTTHLLAGNRPRRR